MKTADKRKPRTSTTYNHKLNRLKKWYNKIEEARKTWSKEKLAKTKPLQPLTWYVEKLRQSGKAEKTVTSTISKKDRGTWFR